jgi:hypothetical protein
LTSVLYALVLVGLYAACGTHSSAPSSPRAAAGVAPSIWSVPTDVCEPWWSAPALLCVVDGRAEPMLFDGCHWHCLRPKREPQQ